jgi:hypothetical protein
MEEALAKPSRRTTTSSSDRECKVVRTSGQIFADGSVIELVTTAPGNRLDVLFWNGHQKSIAHQLEHDGRVYRAHDLDETLLRAIHFPSDANDYGTARQLFSQICKLFQRYVGLSSPESALMTAWCCSTWFQDCVSSPPTLVISSPDMDPAITLFRLLGCLCRRSLLLADITRAGLLSVMALRPTLLIIQSSTPPRIWDLMRMSNYRGFYLVTNRGRVCNVACSKAIFLGMAADTWIAEAIHLALPGQQDLPPLDEYQEAEIANRVQPQLLRYFLHNFRKVRESLSAVRQFKVPVTEIARNLTACIQGDPDIAQLIVPILQRQDQDAQARRSRDVSVAVVEVIWAASHEGKEITITQVAERTNALLRARGETLVYGAVEIGWQLKNLGVDRHRNGGGMVLQFSQANSLLIHRLAQRLGLKLSPRTGCANCDQRGPLAT